MIEQDFYWLASFPRSGNTFLRNIFDSVFGLESGTYTIDKKENNIHHLIKTHLLPYQIIHETKKLGSIYIVRDGRDCAVSAAYRMRDMLKKIKDLDQGIRLNLIPGDLRKYQGWGFHVIDWIRYADIVIRFEDLIENPRQIFENQIIPNLELELPSPNWEKLPTFETQKSGESKYGGFENRNNGKYLREKFFRSGETAGWKKELSNEQSDLFWNLFGIISRRIGYFEDGSCCDNSEWVMMISAFKEELMNEKKFDELYLCLTENVDRALNDQYSEK